VKPLGVKGCVDDNESVEMGQGLAGVRCNMLAACHVRRLHVNACHAAAARDSMQQPHCAG